jgi:two-component system, NtrC family, nitrogen regulation response regulator NtrX
MSVIDPMKSKELTALIVDDEASICESLAGVLGDEGWLSDIVGSGKDALVKVKRKNYDLIFLDIWMPGLDGIETLQRMREMRQDLTVVIMSGHATIETAVKATKLGAFEFIEKPLALEKILPLLESAKKRRVQEAAPLDKALHIVGKSPIIQEIRRQIEIVAPRNSWVLITGENGTGKEAVARNIHAHSMRAGKSFIAVNCAAIPEELIESELFGHEKGAFTNAMALKRGKFELASGGTLFLDEIGDMSLKTQAKILRILQEQTFERIGGQESISIDVRVIAATNKDLELEIQAGKFREDLFYRLNVIPIKVPRLRDRDEDILELCEYFLDAMARELNEERKFLDEQAKKAMLVYEWPGNVRELKNIIERICILARSQTITVFDLPPHIAGKRDAAAEATFEVSGGLSLKQARSDFERNYIVDRLEENQWNVSKTAESLGIERSHLHRKLRAFRIDPKRLRE